MSGGTGDIGIVLLLLTASWQFQACLEEGIQVGCLDGFGVGVLLLGIGGWSL